ncbi:hypothetical protein Mapa_003146 [Marchantia paleacea]|nr:hypothetical protein Mapa_003146 [Marchantia paleacea]
MGVMSRRVLPACGSLCICCPELRARSRQPVKRYKKLLSDIFPKSQRLPRILRSLKSAHRNGVRELQDEPPNDRKIGKLIEYASKNPLRIPKIANGLEQRGYKELRHEHYGTVIVVMRAFNKLLSACRDQMPLFATSVLNIIRVLLEQGRQDSMRILGCLSVVDFVSNQTDATYMRNLDALLPKLCALSRETVEERRRMPLRAAGLQSLSAMITFMGKYSHMPSEFEDIVAVILDNYEAPLPDQEAEAQERTETNHNWVKEVLKVEGRGPVAVMRGALTKLQSNKDSSYFKDPSNLTRIETETPKVWSQICVQNMARLAKEATTVRRILEPMFRYFDGYDHWAAEKGLALAVLRDMQHSMEKSGNEQLFLPVLVRHLDQKSLSENLLMKIHIVEVIGSLAQHSKARATVADIAAMSDLVRHLRKSIQSSLETSKSGQSGRSSLNRGLQGAIQDCLMELAKRINDAAPLFDMMATTLEKLSVNPVIARTTVEAVSVLAQSVANVQDQSYAEQIFPEGLFQELLQAMIHPDVEARVRAHHVFAILLVPLATPKGEELIPAQGRPETSSVISRTSSAFASAAALFEKLRGGEKYGSAEKEAQHEGRSQSNRFEYNRETAESIELTEVGASRNKEAYSSPNTSYNYKLSKDRSMELSMERMAQMRKPTTSSKDMEMSAVRLSGHQAALLLSTMWLSATLPDNVPASYEAIAHTYILTLLFSRAKTSSHKTVIRAFQLALSLRSLVLDSSYTGVQLPPSRRRSLFTLSTAMLVFAGRAYGAPQLIATAKASLTSTAKDPYLELSEDIRLKVIHSPAGYVNVKDYGTAADDRDALNSLSGISISQEQTPEALAALIVGSSTVLEPEDFAVVDQMLQPFSAEEGYGLGPQLYLETPHSRGSPLESRDSLSFDEIIPDTGTSMEDEVSDQSGGELPRLLACFPVPPLAPHAMGVTQLLEAALVTAGQVVSNVSPSGASLSYSAVASQCESFGVGTRKKMSSVLRLDTESSSLLLTFPDTPVQTPMKEQPQSQSQYKYHLEQKFEESLLRSPNLIDFTTPKKAPFSPAWLTFTPIEPWQVFRLPPASPYDNFLKAAGC